MRQVIRLAALIAIGVMMGASFAETMRPLLPQWNGPADFVTSSEERFQPLRALLPASGEVGYLSDQYPGDATQSPDAVRKYYLLQYALSPLVIVRSTDKPIVVGDFNGPINAAVPTAFTADDLGRGLIVIKQLPK